MRVVLDTGTLIAALITANTPPDQVYQAWCKKRFVLVISLWQLEEFRRASRYKKEAGAGCCHSSGSAPSAS